MEKSIVRLSRIFRDRYPDLGVRACVRTLSPLNLAALHGRNGRTHRDILHPKGKESKDWFEGYAIEEVLTIGQKDILENWSEYRDRYLKEMKK